MELKDWASSPTSPLSLEWTLCEKSPFPNRLAATVRALTGANIRRDRTKVSNRAMATASKPPQMKKRPIVPYTMCNEARSISGDTPGLM